MGFPVYNQKDNRWRDYYNPLRGLTLPKVLSLVEAGERGQYADLQWFYHYMERSDAMIYSVIQRRRAALMDCDWDIRVVSGARMRGAKARQFDPALANEQAAFLSEVYDGIENFRDALAFLFSGFFRGLSHVEKHFGDSGEIVKLEPVEQWFWVRDGMFGDWEYNENAVSGRFRGIPIDRGNFVIFESVALDRMLAPLYFGRTLNLKNWASYLDIFGIPSAFLIGPPNASAEKEKEYQEIADALISDGRGYLPNGSDIKYVNGGGGKPPFLDNISYLDRLITLVGTGGLLTMLTESGSGTLAGGAHLDAFQQVARGDAAALSEVFQRDVDLPMLAQAFPGYPALAYFEFAPALSDQASRVVQDAAALAAAGTPVDPAEISEKTGYRLAPTAPAPALLPAAGVSGAGVGAGGEAGPGGGS